MTNTPPPPNPAPQAGDHNASSSQDGVDRDVNSILANLNQEQLASIVAAARASEGTSNGDGNGYSGVDASSILAALPPGLGQAASALTSFASSFKRSNTGEREDGTGEGHEDMEGEHQHHQHQEGDEAKKEEDHYEHHNPEQHGEGNEYAESTAAAIAAMESLAAQTSLQLQEQGGTHGKGRSKKESGPEAERARKDQHKEVERKRRELISNGITELAAIVPGCDAKGVNKTAIINAAVRYIQELKNNEASNIEKWTLEKLLMDQAMNDLNQHLEASRKEVVRLRAELGIEGEPEQPAYHNDTHHEHDHEAVAEENTYNLDPNLEAASREDAAASALSEVAAAAAAAAAEAVRDDPLTPEKEAQAEADVEKATEERKDAAAPKTSGRARGRAEPVAKEETSRSKRSRHA